eukprot:6337508-Lingulodinium_polyedra.AAC.1
MAHPRVARPLSSSSSCLNALSLTPNNLIGCSILRYARPLEFLRAQRATTSKRLICNTCGG